MKKFTYLKLLLVMLTLFASQLVNAQCVASFTYTVDSSGLAVFTNNSMGSYDSSQWSFGDGTGTTLSNPVLNVTHQYNSVGPFIACLTVYTVNGPCQSTFCDTVYYNSAGGSCVAFFTANQIAGTTTLQFLNGSSGLYSSVTWDFGDSSGIASQLNPQHTYTQPGTYTVCLIIANALQQCNDTYCYNVTVGGTGTTCNAQFTHQNNGSTYYFFNANTSGFIYSWTFGDGSNSSLPNPIHQYTATGNFIICLTVTDSAQTCSDTYCDSITISSAGSCQANFSSTYNPLNGGIVNFTDLSTGSASSWLWDFGDSTFSTSQNPSHQYAQNGTYYVCLTITSFFPNCTSTYCAYVVSGNSTGGCQSYFTATPDTSNGVQFTNSSSGNYTGQYWYFGDGGTSTLSSPFHQYANSGGYLVCLSLYYNGAICDSYCDSIVVGNPSNSCIPVFYSYPDSNVFGNGVINFGIFNNCANTQYVWSFGDSTFGSGINPVHQYADSGWFDVCVTAYNSGGTFIYCDSVYANRMGSFSGLNENTNSYLLNIYPNPLTGIGTVEFNLKSTSHVKLDVYSIAGKYISNIADANIQTGTSRIPVDVSQLQNGIYLMRLNVNDNISYQKITVLK